MSESCPCGSSGPFHECCGPFLAGAPAPTAEVLMRARYCAFARGDVEFLIATLAPEVRGEFNRSWAEKMVKDTRWESYSLRETVGGEVGDQTGTVEYVAHYQLRGKLCVHHERASFRRDEDGRWLCSGGEANPKTPPRRVTRVGRNDDCPCGSGKKFKKCCGA